MALFVIIDMKTVSISFEMRSVIPRRYFLFLNVMISFRGMSSKTIPNSALDGKISIFFKFLLKVTLFLAHETQLQETAQQSNAIDGQWKLLLGQ